MNETQIIVEITLMKRGQLHAFADVTLCASQGELTIRGCRVLCPPQQSPWVAFPSVPYEKDGKTKYKEVLECSRGFKKHLVEQILAEYQKTQKGE